MTESEFNQAGGPFAATFLLISLFNDWRGWVWPAWDRYLAQSR